MSRIKETPLGTGVPRLIHQVLINYEGKLPDELQENIERIKAMNPSWEHRLYRDKDVENFIRSEYGDLIFSYYEKIDRSYAAARVDFFRYLLIYRKGGIYLDLKSTTDRPLDDVLLPDDLYILAGWRNEAGSEFEGWGRDPLLAEELPSEYQQWHIIAAPGHPFLKAVIGKVMENIETYRPWSHGVGHKGTFRTTGPVAYTLAIHPLIDHHPYRYVRYNEDIGLRYSIYGFYGHHKLFKAHYLRQVRPLVSMSGLNAPLAAIYCAAVKLFQNLKTLAKQLLKR